MSPPPRPAAPSTSVPALLGVALALLAAAPLGCSSGDADRESLLEQCAAAPGAKASALPELRDAVAAIEQQQGLPAQLEQTAPPDDRNAAAAIDKVLDGPLRTALSKPLKSLTDRDQFDLSDDDLETIERLTQRHAERIERLKAAAELPTAQFPLAPRLGYFANTAYLDNAAIACRFELVAAMVALLEPPLGDALPPLERAARWIGWLAREPRLEPRLLAAQLRREWLLLVEAIAAHPSGTLAGYDRLRAVLTGWLAEWPDAASAVRGDRAATLHAYEAVRVGLLNQIVAADEWERLKKRGVTADAPPSGEALDRDLLAYLRVIDRLVVLLNRPHHRRAAKHKNVAAMLATVGADGDGAPLAAEMFLPGLPSSLERLAVDRAACEAWAIALSAAGGFRLPEHRINPHTGEPYRVDRLPRSLVVQSGDAAVRDPFALLRAE